MDAREKWLACRVSIVTVSKSLFAPTSIADGGELVVSNVVDSQEQAVSISDPNI